MPRLRRCLLGWQIEGTPLMLQKYPTDPDWLIRLHVTVLIGDTKIRSLLYSWLEEAGLADALFRTRAEATRAIAAAIAVNPLPAVPAIDSADLPPLLRRAKGEYVTPDGKWKVRRSRLSPVPLWVVEERDPTYGQAYFHARFHAQSLHEARVCIAAKQPA